MGILTTHNLNANEQKFNGIRRTKEGLLYLTSIDPNSESTGIQFSNFVEHAWIQHVLKFVKTCWAPACF